MATPSHKHVWYPISFDQETGQARVFACREHYSCVATATLEPEKLAEGVPVRIKDRKLVAPEPQGDRPTGGRWGV
jgi:hypothetical protein